MYVGENNLVLVAQSRRVEESWELLRMLGELSLYLETETSGARRFHLYLGDSYALLYPIDAIKLLNCLNGVLHPDWEVL